MANQYDRLIITAQYKVNQRIKIYLSDEPSKFLCTFGEVVAIKEGNKPVVKYKDFSSLSTGSFNRLIDISKVEFSNKYVKHDLIYKYQI